jgi:hypothetical protein
MSFLLKLLHSIPPPPQLKIQRLKFWTCEGGEIVSWNGAGTKPEIYNKYLPAPIL